MSRCQGGTWRPLTAAAYGTPSSVTWPASSRSRPASSRRTEVLPAPLSPTTTVVLPAGASKATSSANAPRRLARRASSTGGERGEARGGEPDREQHGEGDEQQQDRQRDGRI